MWAMHCPLWQSEKKAGGYMSELQNKIVHVLAVLDEAARHYAPVVFASSLGAEDMVLTDLIARHQPDIGIFSLDTGRLPQETYDLMQEVRRYYGIPLTVYFPDGQLVEQYVAQHGVNGFYDSMENRKGCCFARKVEPLRRALKDKGAWITGLRRDQAVTRGTLEMSSFDADNGLQKFNPLLDWTNNEVWAYIRQHDVPYNKLHDQFYPSLGCAPCTRSVTPGEDIRAGRWWWENPETKECGLHASHSPKGGVAHGFGVSAQGNVGSKAGDVSRSHDPESNECGLHVSSSVAHGTGVQLAGSGLVAAGDKTKQEVPA
jgi:phosphoadenosine phosphosulfate reductase